MQMSREWCREQAKKMDDIFEAQHKTARQHYKNYTGQKQGCLEELDKAISISKSALEEMPHFHRDKRMLHDDLATMLFVRYKARAATNEMDEETFQNLTDAIKAGKEAVQSPFRNDRRGPDQLHSFSQMVYQLFAGNHIPEFEHFIIAEKAIEAAEAAIQALGYQYTDEVTLISELQRIGNDDPRPQNTNRRIEWTCELMRMYSSLFEIRKTDQNDDRNAKPNGHPKPEDYLYDAINIGKELRRKTPKSHPQFDLISQSLKELNTLRGHHGLKRAGLEFFRRVRGSNWKYDLDRLSDHFTAQSLRRVKDITHRDI